jgi:antibiotic biosynthesis monooxygenase (ABM) superfamily enzyme
MPRVIFTISYDVNPDRRADYLALTQEMKQRFAGSNGKTYAIYEQKGKKNSFSEVFMFNSMEEYDQLEDQDDQMGSIVQRLEKYLAGGKMKYTTLLELE